MWAGHITEDFSTAEGQPHTLPQPGAGTSMISTDKKTVLRFYCTYFCYFVLEITSQFQSSPVRVSTNWAPVGFLKFFQEKDHVLVPFVQIADLRSRWDAQEDPQD